MTMPQRPARSKTLLGNGTVTVLNHLIPATQRIGQESNEGGAWRCTAKDGHLPPY